MISEDDVPELFEQWTGSFARLLEEKIEEGRQIRDNLLILRLTPRSGRYGEVPQRTQNQELLDEPKEQVWPSHPSRRTETYVLEPVPKRYCVPQPTVYLREDYALGLYHRGYGIGSHLYSMSLLPEEEQTIVMKSFKDTKTKVTENTAENIFEETGSETANDFANEMAAENQRESNNQEEFSIAAKASGGFAFAKASVETGYSSQSSVKDFAKNTSNVTKRLASKLSAKRAVSVDTKRTVENEQELHSELSTERTIRNPNMGHTLTYHWFQITRKYQQELTLEDMKLVYTSGKHNIARIFVKDPSNIRHLEKVGCPLHAINDVVAEMPSDVAQLVPPNAVVLVVTEPYTEVVSMAGANAFLARVFEPNKAMEISSQIWQLCGYGAAAPEGLGVLAFPGYEKCQLDWENYIPLYHADPSSPASEENTSPAQVAADRITIAPKSYSTGQTFEIETIYLPNLDVRYKLQDGLVPSRYTADYQNAYSVPRKLSSEDQIMNTNGVFCDAMVGRCTALEDYLQRHRDLDLLEKKVQVGRQEHTLSWALAQDNLVHVDSSPDKPLTTVIGPKEDREPFGPRLAVEYERQVEAKAIAEAQLDKRKAENELERLEMEVSAMRRRIELLGTASAVKIDAPEGADVAVHANVDIDRDEDGGGEHRIDIE